MVEAKAYNAPRRLISVYGMPGHSHGQCSNLSRFVGWSKQKFRGAFLTPACISMIDLACILLVHIYLYLNKRKINLNEK
jgi:hypothetical protein